METQLLLRRLGLGRETIACAHDTSHKNKRVSPVRRCDISSGKYDLFAHAQ